MTLLDKKELPYDLEAEEAVNGSLLIDGEAINLVAHILEPKDFYNPPNRLIYSAAIALNNRREQTAINQITVAEELDRQGLLEKSGGVSYLSHLVSAVPTSLDIEHYAEIVYRHSKMRDLIAAAEKISEIGHERDPNVSHAISMAEDLLIKIRDERSSEGLIHIKTLLDRYFESPTDDGRIGIIPTGFNGIDKCLNGGMHRSDLIIIAARPSMGKSSFAMNIARHAAVASGAKVAVFSLEMSRQSLVDRLISAESGINSRFLHISMQSTAQDESRILEAQATLAEASIYIDDSAGVTISEIRSKVRQMHAQYGVDLVIVDYLQLIQGESKTFGLENRVQEVSHITRSLKLMAKEIDVPIIALSQLSRATEKRERNKRPMLSDLRDSGSIEQDADIVMFIYRADVYFKTAEQWAVEHPGEDYPENIAEIEIAKHRNGQTDTINLYFRKELTRFENLLTVQEY